MAKLKINLIPSLQKLNLFAKGLVSTRFMGNYASVFKGQGLEFADYRVYSPSDDASLIDWKASSRARKLLIKEFMEERNIDVYFIVDVSSKMMLGSMPKLKAEYVAELVASFAHTVLKAGDHVGVTMFADNISKDILPGAGLGHLRLLTDSLSNLNNYGGESNLNKALAHALKTFPPGSLVILISDFIGETNFEKELKFVAQKFDLICMMVRDPIDMELPSGMGEVLVQDPVTGERMLIYPNDLKEYYSKETKREIAHLVRLFRDVGADFLPLYTNKSFVEDLIIFFKQRQSEWR